jgi:acyl-coenzyme A synthetase/AMP-(fatty) acid ligase
MYKMELKWASVAHLLEQAAQNFAEKTLFIYEDKKRTFYEIDRQVNRTANALRALGVAKGDKVSVMLPNGFEFPVIWLACAKLNAVMVPANINYRAHDLEYILIDLEATTLVIHKDYFPVLDEIKSRLVQLKNVVVLGGTPSGYHSYEDMTEKASSEFEIGEVKENDLLNIQYTSGTTGFPKGCMLTHRYWLILGFNPVHLYGITSKDINLTAPPFYYLDPQWNVILCLAAGIPLVIMPRFSPSKFWTAVKANNVTMFYVLGTMPLLLMKQEENPELEKNHRLRFVICSGIVPQLHETFEKRWNVCWREVYGSTESGGDLGVLLDDSESVGSGSVGIPWPTKEAKIIDDKGNEVPTGKIGELVVRGEPMFQGYWKNPEATEEAFSGGWRHTGDLFYRDDKGHFYLTGRLKDMIRRSDENIAAAEVEGVLIEHDKIKMAAVVAVPDDLRGEEVKAYIVLQGGESKVTLPPEEIVEFAKQKLAYFKVPRYIEYMDDLPRTPSERIEKHKLIETKDDLRTDSYDAVDKLWR